MAGDQNGKPKSLRPGDPCPRSGCAGVLVTYSTHINFAISKRFRYFHCPACKHESTYGKFAVPLEYARPLATSSKHQH